MGKKAVVILLSALLLNSSTEIHQLWKLPFLFQHYLHHREKDSSISFISFLKIHYTDKDHPNDNDDRDDNELPFKSVGNISHIDTPVMEKKTAVTGYFMIAEKPSAYYPEGVLYKRSFSIFHPPRIA